MKTIGYAGAQLWGCKYGPYSVVVCAPDQRTARDAFIAFMKNHDHEHPYTPHSGTIVMRRTKSVGNRPLLWAQVDVTM